MMLKSKLEDEHIRFYIPAGTPIKRELSDECLIESETLSRLYADLGMWLLLCAKL